MSNVVRALLWIVLIVAPGGVLLLPLLLGDAMRRKKGEAASKVDAAGGALPAPLSTR